MITKNEAGDGKDQEKLLSELGQLNLQLLEEIREGHIQPQMKILEIGCGYGYNIRFFIKHGYDAYGIDESEEAIQLIREYVPGWNSKLKVNNFRAAVPESLPFDDDYFDYAYALHFSEITGDGKKLSTLLKEAMRVLKSSGVLFLQLETSIGLQGKVLHIVGNKYLMQDGKEKILWSEDELKEILNQVGCNTLPIMKTLLYHSRMSITFLSLTKK